MSKRLFAMLLLLAVSTLLWADDEKSVFASSDVNEMTFTFDDEHEFYQYSKTTAGRGYYKFKPKDPQALLYLFYNFDDPYWKSSNPGYAVRRGSNAKPEEYPTTVGFQEGADESNCLVMQTASTGALGSMVKIYIDAGCLFNGEFDEAEFVKSRSAARQSTKFGTPCLLKPLSMTVDIKYVPGQDYWDEDKNVLEGVVDEPDAYIVLFRNDMEGGMLDATNV